MGTLSYELCHKADGVGFDEIVLDDLAKSSHKILVSSH